MPKSEGPIDESALRLAKANINAALSRIQRLKEACGEIERLSSASVGRHPIGDSMLGSLSQAQALLSACESRVTSILRTLESKAKRS